MEGADKPSFDPNSMDLYSRVKLRSLTRRKACTARKNYFPPADEEFVDAGLRASKSNFAKRRSLVDSATYVENQARKNDIAVETAGLERSLVLVAVNEIDEWRNYNTDLSTQRNTAHEFDDSNHILDEGTAIEMLDQLRQGRTENSWNQFNLGDLVWGKITSYPWWPGQIYNEALASPSVKSTKKKGRVLVAFFGDYTYAWLNPRDLIPFDIHYAVKSRQTNDRVFELAVNEAVTEFKRRAVLGMACRCHNPSNFLPMKYGGLLYVDFNGFIAGGFYSGEQIKKARDEFQPDEIFAFLKQMAVTPRNNTPNNLSLLKNVLKVLYYQRDCYFRSYAKQRSSQNPKAALLDVLEAKAWENQLFKHPTEANGLQEDDILGQKHRLTITGGRFCHEGSGDHEMKISSYVSDPAVSEALQIEPLQMQIRSDGALNAGKKRNISGFLEYSSLQKPVRQKNMKNLAKISGSQKHFEIHNENGTGIESSSSIKLEKEPVTESSSNGINAEPNQPLVLVIKFPPGVILPSVSELKAKFTPFGQLQESSISILQESSICQIVFHRIVDAAEAYLHAIQNRSLFSSPVSYDLQIAGVVGSELLKESHSHTLPFAEANKDIQPEPSLIRADYLKESKPTVQLLPSPEKIKLKPCVEGPRVESLSAMPFLESNRSDSETSRHMIPVSSQSTPLCYTSQPFDTCRNFDDVDKKYCQVEAMRNNDCHTIHTPTGLTNTSDTGKNDKLIDLLNLLYSCSDILEEIKPLI